jgi:hypothetical protein
MYRIVAIAAGAAMFAGMTTGAVSAGSCDQRIAGSCPIEPIVQQAEPSVEAAPARPLVQARAGKERSVRRGRHGPRHLSRSERRRTARNVARELARERAPVKVAARRQQVEAAPQPRAEAPAAPANATEPGAATILSPNLVQTVELRRPRLDAGLMAVPSPPTGPTAAEPAENTGQAAPEPPVPSVAADNATDAGQARVEPVRAAASGSSDALDLPWLRFAFLAFGGLLALGSAIRLFV